MSKVTPTQISISISSALAVELHDWTKNSWHTLETHLKGVGDDHPKSM
jgi:hypothetical protein